MKSLFTILTFTKINTRRFFRDRLAIFFTIVFPLIFLVIFGGLFKNSGEVSFKVAIINDSKSSYSKQFLTQARSNKIFKIDEKATTLDQAKEKMQKSELDAAIVLPQNFGQQVGQYPTGNAVVYYSQNNSQAGQTLVSILQEQFNQINAKLVSQTVPFTVSSQSTNQKRLTQFDYIFAGMIGFSIIGLGIFGPVNVFPELKKQGILRRLHTTTLRVWQYFTSNVISQGIIGLLAIAILFAFSIFVFNLQMVGNYFDFTIFIIISIVTIYGIGLAVGGWAKNERQAAPLANLLVFPMIFLSGTFFPRFLMPEWLQNVSYYLPLTPINEGIRLIVTEGKNLTELGPQLGLIGLWAVIIYIIAFRIFRWE